MALPAGLQIEYIKYNALNLRNMEISREGLRFQTFLSRVPVSARCWCGAREERGETGCSGVEGGEADGIPVKEEMLCGILAKRKSWAGLKHGKKQTSSPAWLYVPSAFVSGITCGVRCC